MTVGKSSGKRAEKARATRKRMLDAARDLFVEHGYGATALQDVADRAGVAVQTIYFTFGNKRTLLKEVVDVSIAGDDEPVATMDRPWFEEALAAPTVAGQLAVHVPATGEILERVAPVTKVLATAVATDPEVSAMWPSEVDPRYTVMLTAATSLVGKPDARQGMSAEQAADLLYGLLSPELYLVFVHDRCWSNARWVEWARGTLAAQLCAPVG
ncbi:TetR family transcriptional regulator [Stackebrandtia endophytica]|uniref:TetR family transcriptional regulator n=1 Tax=Stackebrandtia endophytica TaxID=1496996 RepID=A0A543AUI8_9ACTN|nr:helix-turn-helix domain-containing protein [Stackebrandtia endophytica]TQL76246.1 TetR family transcriptional regulator [Stackebrandtia endophytica]